MSTKVEADISADRREGQLLVLDHVPLHLLLLLLLGLYEGGHLTVHWQGGHSDPSSAQELARGPASQLAHHSLFPGL